MKLFTMESEQNTYAAEIEAIQAEKEAAISSLVTAKEDLLKAKDAIFYTIGTETYAQYCAGSNECELMNLFLQIKDIEVQVLATDEKMAEIAQHYDAEITALEAKAATPIPPVVEAPAAQEVPVAPIPEEVPAPAPTPAPTPAPAPAFCEDCGKKLGGGDIFCQFCGTRIAK